MTAIVNIVRNLIASDKTALVGILVGFLGVFAGRFGLHLNATETGWLSSGIAALIGLILHVKLNAAAKSSAPASTSSTTPSA